MQRIQRNSLDEILSVTFIPSSILEKSLNLSGSKAASMVVRRGIESPMIRGMGWDDWLVQAWNSFSEFRSRLQKMPSGTIHGSKGGIVSPFWMVPTQNFVIREFTFSVVWRCYPVTFLAFLTSLHFPVFTVLFVHNFFCSHRAFESLCWGARGILQTPSAGCRESLWQVLLLED